MTDNKNLDEALYKASINILNENNGTDYETLVVLDARTGKEITRSSTKQSGKSGLTNDEYAKISNNKELALNHNHPNSSPHSITDIMTMYKNPNIKYSIVSCHNGDVYELSNMNRRINLEKEYQKIYNKNKEKYMVKPLVLSRAKEELLLKAKQHGWFTLELFKNGKKEK